MSEPYFYKQELADMDAYYEVEFIGEKIKDFNDRCKWNPHDERPSEEDMEAFYQDVQRDQQKLQFGLENPMTMISKEALSAINAAADNPYPKMSQLAEGMLEHNLPRIKEMLSSKQHHAVVLEALSKIAGSSQKSSEHAKETIANNIDLIKEELNSESGKISALHALNMILDSDNEEVANKSKQLLQNAIINPETGLDPEIVGESLLMEKDSARIITGELICT